MRSTSTKRWRFLLALLAATALVVAACSNSGDDESSSDTTEADSGSTDTTAAGEQVSVDQPGVTDTEIRFSALGTQANNPLGTCVLDCYTDGIRACVVALLPPEGPGCSPERSAMSWSRPTLVTPPVTLATT